MRQYRTSDYKDYKVLDRAAQPRRALQDEYTRISPEDGNPEEFVENILKQMQTARQNNLLRA